MEKTVTTKPYEEITEEEAKAMGIQPWKLSEETKEDIQKLQQLMMRYGHEFSRF